VRTAQAEFADLDHLDVAVVVTDLEGVITAWNPAAESLYGWSLEEAVGRSVAKLLVPRSGDGGSSRILRLLLSRQPGEDEIEVVRKDGTVVPVYVSVSLLYDGSGQPERIVAFGFDVTERKRAERRLAVQFGVTSALAGSATLAEAAPSILRAICQTVGWRLATMWRVDHGAGVLRCVDVWPSDDPELDEFTQMTRRRPFEPGVGLPGRVWSTGKPHWIPDVALDDNFPRASAAGQAGLRGAFGFPLMLGDLVLGMIEAFSPKIEEPDERLLELMAAIGSQIGQFIERREAEEAVRVSEARKRAILEASLDCIIAMDGEGRITEFNPAAERTFGYTRSEVLGRELAEMLIPPSLREAHRRGLARYLKTGEGPILDRRWEFTAVRRDGSEFPVELAVTRVDLPGWALFEGALRDITDRRQAEEDRGRLLQAERIALEEAESSRRRLAFLAEANTVLASSLDFAATLTALGRLAVTLLADICLIDVLIADGSIRRMAAVHADPELQPLTDQLLERYGPLPGGPHPAVAVMETGKPAFSPVMTEQFLRKTTRDEEHFRLTQELGFQSYIFVTLIARERILSTITLVSTDPDRRYGPADVAVTEDLARRTALTVDNARLYEAQQGARMAAERAAERTAVLQAVTAALAEVLTPEDAADVIVQRAIDAFGANAGAVAVPNADGERLELLSWRGYRESSMRAWTTFPVDSPMPMAEAVRTGQPLFIGTREEFASRYPDVTDRDPGNHALACVPLSLKGRAVGAMSLTFAGPRDFDPEDRGLLLAVARQGAQAIERARAYDAERAARSEAEAARQRLAFLAEASSVLASEVIDYEATLQTVARLAVPEFADWCEVDLAGEMGSIERVALAHVDPEKERLGAQLSERYPLDPDAPSGVANVLRTGRSELIEEITEEMLRERVEDPDLLGILRDLGLRSAMTVPLIARARTIGAMSFVTAESGRNFGPADLQLAEEIARRAALAVDNARLYQERSYVARTLQQNLLPPKLPTIPGIDLAALYRPSGEGTEIGGDFYDLFQTTDGAWAVAIGDVCGKGADAASVIGLVRYTVRAVAMQEQRPSRVLSTLNEALRQQIVNERFCTVAYARVRSSNGKVRLTICCGGHPLPLVLRADGSVERVGQPGTLLGVFPDPELTDEVVDLEPGDAIVFYTDGVTEERMGERIFGEEGLASVLEASSGLDAQAIARAIGSAVESFRPHQPRDDMAILVLRVKA